MNRKMKITVADLKKRLSVVPQDFRSVLVGLKDTDQVNYTFMVTPMGNYPMSVSRIIPRRNKKQEYLNGLDHDIKYFTEEIAKGKPFWFLGDRYYIFTAKARLNEMLADQTKIALDKTYKPWKEIL